MPAPEQRGERGGGWPWELRAWSRHCGIPVCMSLGAGWGYCLVPALWTGVLGATEVAVTWQRQEDAWRAGERNLLLRCPTLPRNASF